MKKQYFLPTLLVMLSLGLFTQCGMRKVTFRVMRPAEITFPSHVDTLLLVDRTKFEKQAGNIIEGLLTGEMPGEDRAGIEETMNSFQQTLRNSPRFEMVRASESLNGNSLTSTFPAPLSWSKVEELCKKYNTDAIVAIEIFDTDFIPTSGSRQVKKIIEDKGIKREIMVNEYYASGVANAKVGFRLYDPKNKSIADQQLFNKSKTWEATGTSAAEAVSQLIRKTEATRYVGGLAGSNYAYKISPLPVYLERNFYSRPKKVPQLAAGSRRADVNDWTGAIETWERGLKHAPQKHRGKLAYNISVAYEVLGDLENAKKWCSKAYVDYNSKIAREYSYALDQRVRDTERLKQQMNE